MFEESLYPKTKQVLAKLSKTVLMKDFYLAGGTALALQIGHRKSIDLDFFTSSNSFPSFDSLLNKLKEFNPDTIAQSEGTLDVIIDSVKVSFLVYDYPLVLPLVDYPDKNNIRLASTLDIACMKLSAISSRGSKKDFVDLYFLLQTYTLKEIFTAFVSKFEGIKYSELHFLRSLNYFEDAEKDPDPDFLKDVKWSSVKSFIQKEVIKYLN
jgi:predicted nucleotidyltransferase